MKSSSRLDQAITKLYQAFHNGSLHPECCKQCAVGTVLDQTDTWKHLSDDHGSLHLNYVGQVNEAFGRRFNGYKPSELLLIEQTFLKGCGYQVPLHYKNRKPKDTPDRNLLFQGFCAVITLLCELDNSPNILNTKIFKQIIDNTALTLATP